MTAFGSSGSPLMTSLGHTAFTPEPAHVADSSTGGFVVAADRGSNSMMVWQMTGTGASPTLTALGEPSVPVFSLPANIPQPSPAPSSDVLDSSDLRLTQAIAAADPNIAGSPETVWTSHTVDSGAGGAASRWYEILPGTPPTVVQSGTITDASGNTFNSAIAPTANGGAVINYDSGGASQLVQVMAQSRIGSAPAGAMNNPITLASSTVIDGDFSCPSNSGGTRPCRWGDYAGASVDPNNPSVVWGTAEFNGPVPTVATAAQWATENFALMPNDVAPSASFTVSSNPAAGAPVSFDGGGSSDPDGTISSYSWNFGDGSAAATGATPSHVYAAPGTYTVTLTVTDNGGVTANTSQSVAVDELPSAAFSSSPASPGAGKPVSFDGSTSADPDGSIASYAWNFGDGSAAGSGATPTHAYASASTYTVTLTVTDSSGLTATTTQGVTVDELPTAGITVTTAHPAKNVPVQFNGTPSKDIDGSIVTYGWSFGDGSAAGSGATPKHTYTRAGTFTVTLIVTDSAGFVASITTSVKVVTGSTISKTKVLQNKKGTFLQLKFTGPGFVTINGHRFRIRKAGTVKFKLTLSKALLNKLHKNHKLKVKIKIKFVPDVGRAFTETVIITFRT
jgi:PKD repeat protein